MDIAQKVHAEPRSCCQLARAPNGASGAANRRAGPAVDPVAEQALEDRLGAAWRDAEAEALIIGTVRAMIRRRVA